MKKSFSMEVTNEVMFNNDGLSIIEIHNKIEGRYDYYLYKEQYSLQFVFGVTSEKNSPRESTIGLIQLYENGYFDPIIEESFI